MPTPVIRFHVSKSSIDSSLTTRDKLVQSVLANCFIAAGGIIEGRVWIGHGIARIIELHVHSKRQQIHTYIYFLPWALKLTDVGTF